MAIYKRNLSSVEVNHNYSFGEYGITSTRKINNFNETEFQLYQNYPNPFNPSTSISFNVPELSYVSLYIYNSLGQQVYRLQDKQYSTGTYSYEFDGSSLSSGIYYYSIKATSNKGKKFINTKKMLLIK
jgi:hypothetical protein